MSRALFPHSTHTQVDRNGSLTGFPLGVFTRALCFCRLRFLRCLCKRATWEICAFPWATSPLHPERIFHTCPKVSTRMRTLRSTTWKKCIQGPIVDRTRRRVQVEEDDDRRHRGHRGGQRRHVPGVVPLRETKACIWQRRDARSNLSRTRIATLLPHSGH